VGGARCCYDELRAKERIEAERARLEEEASRVPA